MKNWLELLENSKKEDIPLMLHEKLKFSYRNKDIKSAHTILDSSWKNYIDLSIEKSSVFEFVCLLKDPNLIELQYFIKWADNHHQLKNIHVEAISNNLLVAIHYNNINLVKYLTQESFFPKVDFSYANYAIIKQCFPNNTSIIKENIFKYFITDCSLEKDKFIENFLRKQKKDYIIDWFNKRELFKSLENTIDNTKNNIRVNKI